MGIPRRVIAFTCLTLLLATTSFAGQKQQDTNLTDQMSQMGQVAARIAAGGQQTQTAGTLRIGGAGGTLNIQNDTGGTPNGTFCTDDAPVPCTKVPGGYADVPIRGGQAETTIAVDTTGQHIVVGYNDTRGFATSPISVSGVIYSDDGGTTWVDGGQLPTSGGPGTTPGAVSGDPDVKYVGACTFIYSSIFVKTAGGVQTMSIHRSTDCGHTWEGPFEVTSATIAGNSADKEFIDVDPDTGRVIMSWSNFTASTIQISTTFSDDITATPPTWSARVIVESSTSVQSSVPRFSKGTNDVYLVWRRTPTTNIVKFARSTNNGASWTGIQELGARFYTPDQILGNDRIAHSPSMEVDRSGGTYNNSIYVVVSDNDTRDGADVRLQKSTDGGLTWSPVLKLNARIGADRSQWWPTLAVDKNTGRVYVFYYDQGVATSGDLTETSMMYSGDGGTTWSKPRPLRPRPWKAGWGNDTGQPNLGDYNMAVAQNGELFASYAETEPQNFTDGLPVSTSLLTPDVFVSRTSAPTTAAVLLDGVTFTESGGNGIADAGDQLKMKFKVRNHVTNPLNAAAINTISGTLTSATPGVTFPRSVSAYPNLAAGASATNSLDYVVQVAPGFVPGTPIEFALNLTTSEGPRTLLYTLNTGTPIRTTLLAEDFNAFTPGNPLPDCTVTPSSQWCSFHQGGNNTVPWTTSSTYCGATSTALFHTEANDGNAGNHTRFERGFSPVFSVPGDAQYVTLDFDICYDTEDDAGFNVLGWDGALLRITDVINAAAMPPTAFRSVLAEAFESEFTTGSNQHYPKHFPRSSDGNYFQDMSAWAGDSAGWKHVRMRLPGMQGRTAQLRYEYTQDRVGLCSDLRAGHTCGVAIDNLVVSSVTTASYDLKQLKLTPTGTTGVYNGQVILQAPAPAGGFSVALSSSAPAQTTLPGSVAIAGGATTSPTFTVTLNPTYTGINVKITATPILPAGAGPAGAKSATIRIN